MRELLNKTIQRRLTLIGALARLNTWVAVEQLVQLLDCTDKTLMKDVEAINDEWEAYLQLDFSKRRGLAIRAGQTNKIKNVYKQVIRESSEFQFLEQLFFEPTQDADYWMAKLFMSETSFYRMVRQISKALKEYGLNLERKPFSITAKDERWVRLFYQSYFEEAYGGIDEWPFVVDQKSMFCFVLRSSSDFDVILDDRELIQHAYLLMITCIRANQGFLLSDELYCDPEDIIDQIVQMSTKHMEQLLADTPYILVEKWYREVSRGVFYEFYSWDNPQQEVRIKTAVDKFLNKLASSAELPLTPEDHKKISQRMMHWYLSYTIYPYDRSLLLKDSLSSARNIRRLFPIFSKLVEVNLKEIEKECNFPWAKIREDEILCLLLKDWSGLAAQLEYLRQQVTVLVVSERGIKHSKMMRAIIKGQFSDKVMVDIFNQSVFFISPNELACFREYDIVIAINPLPNYQDENLLLVDTFMSEADWNRLQHRILKTQKRISDTYIANLDINQLNSGKKVYPKQVRPVNIANFVMEDHPEDFFSL